MDFKAMMKAAEDYELREPLTIEELFDLMEKSSLAFQGQFILKKGLFGKTIIFDTFAEVQPRVSVKNKTVKVRKIETNSGSTGPSHDREDGITIDFVAAARDIKAFKEGGFEGMLSAYSAGPEYFHNVCDRMRELLQDRLEG